jgi:RHS repeat-associated protein
LTSATGPRVLLQPDRETDSRYDLHGQLVEIDSPQGAINYAYDPATGAETDVTTANTHVHYAYNDLGLLQTVTADKLNGSTLGTPLVTTYSYDADNNLVHTLLPNGTAETRQYDDLNRLTSIETDNAAGQIVSSSLYALNPDGTRAGVTDNAGRTGLYAYDPLGRLVKETILDSTSGSRVIAFTYDLAGNRLTKTDTGCDPAQQSLAYSYDDNDRLLSVINTNNSYSESYTYDANGSTRTVTTNGAVTTDTWDLQGRLVHVDQPGGHTIDDTYDDAGNRTAESVDGAKTTFLNDPNQAYDQVLEEYAPGGVLAATYVRGMDLLFQDRAGVRSYYAKDGLGSTRALTNSAGAVTDTYTYDASGDLTGSTGITTNEFLFAGYQNDVALGQDYLRARYLDTAAGRFSSRDTVDGSSSDPITLNSYIYAGDDSSNNVDLSGHDFIGTLSAIGIGLNIASIGFDAYQLGRAAAERRVNDAAFYSASLSFDLILTVLPFSGFFRGGGRALLALEGGSASLHVSTTVLKDLIEAQRAWGGIRAIWGGSRGLSLMSRVAGSAGDPTGPIVPAKLTQTQSDAYRRSAQRLWEKLNDGLNAWKDLGLRIHHRIPLEWSHLFPDSNPNALANLVGVPDDVHKAMSNMWTDFRTSLKGRLPTAREVLGKADEIENRFGALFRYIDGS